MIITWPKASYMIWLWGSVHALQDLIGFTANVFGRILIEIVEPKLSCILMGEV